MSICIKRGLDLRIAGAICDATCVGVNSEHVAVYPGDFPGFVPKADVRPGDKVAAGSPLLHDKAFGQIKLTSPVSGTVTDVVRGERRRIICVKLTADKSGDSAKFDTAFADRDTLVTLLAESGLLAMMRRRPFDIVPHPDDVVRDIFVTAFDSAPLMPIETFDDADIADMELAVKALSLIAREHIYISHRSGQFDGRTVGGAVMTEVKGPHPAGNVGVQIANIRPVNKGEVVWTMSARTLVRIGSLLRTGAVDWTTKVAVCGSALLRPTMIRTVAGASITELVAERIDADDNNGDKHHRIISGNVLTGVKVELDGYLRWPYTQVTVIPEGDDVDEFMGWASLSSAKMSINPSFPGHFLRKVFNPDARILGGRRAMIMSGLIDKVLPMDIMGEYLIKAFNARDIDRMEALGAYEVAPEDFALAECIDSSKVPYQQIVREGLEYMRNELS